MGGSGNCPCVVGCGVKEPPPPSNAAAVVVAAVDPVAAVAAAGNFGPGVIGVCGLDEFGVTGIRGVNGFAAGLSTNFLTKLDFSDEVDSFKLPLQALIVPALVLLFVFELGVVAADGGVLLLLDNFSVCGGIDCCCCGKKTKGHRIIILWTLRFVRICLPL